MLYPEVQVHEMVRMTVGQGCKISKYVTLVFPLANFSMAPRHAPFL